MNEIVFIGQNIEKEKMMAGLEHCLCTEAEIKAMEKGIRFRDDFPVG